MARATSDPSEKLRDAEVLAKAAQVFHDRGYASSSVQLIADELGILKGSLYYYTRSKEDLLYRILKGVHDDLGVILDEVESTDATPLDRIHLYVERQVRYATHNIRTIAIYYRDADQLSQQHQDTINRQRREHAAFLKRTIMEAQADGSAIAAEDPTVLSDLIFGSFIWTYRWFDEQGKLGADEVARAAADFAVRAIKA